jgi:hypothetical protein
MKARDRPDTAVPPYGNPRNRQPVPKADMMAPTAGTSAQLRQSRPSADRATMFSAVDVVWKPFARDGRLYYFFGPRGMDSL